MTLPVKEKKRALKEVPKLLSNAVEGAATNLKNESQQDVLVKASPNYYQNPRLLTRNRRGTSIMKE